MEAGYEEVIFHDTGRTAVRRMEDAAIPRREAMQITGHLTETVYKRYDIGSEAGATEAGRKLREHEAKLKFAPKFSPDKGAGGLRATPAIDHKSLN